MRAKARTVAAISLGVLIVDFFTLENGVVTTSPVAQRFGLYLGLLALAGLVGGSVALIASGLGRLAARRSTRAERPATQAQPDALQPTTRKARVARSRFRKAKVLIGLLVLASWFAGMPFYFYETHLANAPGFEAGPWAVDAFFSVYAVAAQCLAPTLFALAFWPSAVMAVCLLLSRRDRPVLDTLFALGAVGPAAWLWLRLSS